MHKVEVVKFYPFELPGRKGGLVGYADVKVNDSILIRMIRLMRNRHGGYYVQMPSQSKGDTSHAIVEILSRDLLAEIRRKVVDFYKEMYKIS